MTPSAPTPAGDAGNKEIIARLTVLGWTHTPSEYKDEFDFPSDPHNGSDLKIAIGHPGNGGRWIEINSRYDDEDEPFISLESPTVRAAITELYRFLDEQKGSDDANADA